MSKLELGRGAAYIYIELISALFSAYIFWIIISKFTSTEVIGTSSAVISFATIFTTIVTLGVPSGIQRFLGKTFSTHRLGESKVLVLVSFVTICFAIIVCTLIILGAKDIIHYNFNLELTIVSLVLIGSSAIYSLLRSIVISSLKTRMLPIASIVSTTGKIAIAVVLVLGGTGALGITISFAFVPIFTSALLAFSIKSVLKASWKKAEITFTRSLRDILTASMPSWIPAIITTIGSQLGTIVVLGSQGASQAGLYFIAFSIVTGISLVMSALASIAYPALSAMSDGRKRFSWRVTKLSLIIALPFSCSILFYSKDIMQLFGHNYLGGTSALEILLVSILPTGVFSTITVLVYAYGNYRQVLIIGLASSIPRTALYFVLVPMYGGVGAAVAYTIGSIVGLLVSALIANKIQMRIFWKELALLSAIPASSAFALNYVGVQYVIGVPITIVLSYIIYLKLRILARSDLEDATGVLPSNLGRPLSKVLNSIGKKLDRSY